MTFGKMLKLTERFNQIIGGAQCRKDKRLAQFYAELRAMDECYCSIFMEMAVVEEVFHGA